LWGYAPFHGAVALLVALVFGLSIAYGRVAPDPTGTLVRWDAFGTPWLDGYARWDGGWYLQIATAGYHFDRTTQSPIPFFPLYSLAMRHLARLTAPIPDSALCDPRAAVAWGIALNALAGAAAVWLLACWTSRWLGASAGREAAITLSCYPFAFYLCGPVYSEALFLALALGAFVALERGRPALAIALGALATAARPIGPALVVGLFVAALERRGALERAPGALRTRWVPARFAWRDLAVLATAAGGIAYWLYLFRFATDEVPGWRVYVDSTSPVGWHKQHWVVWLKLEAWEQLAMWPWRGMQLVIAFHLGLTLVAYALLPAIARRCGWGAAAYTFIALLLPTVTNKDFVAMGRYCIEAFPCFAIAGAFLAGHTRWRWPVRVAGVAAMVGFASLFARWYYVS